MSKYTPDTEEIAIFRQVARLRYSNESIGAEAREKQYEHFGNMLEAIEAAAEQRGAAPFVDIVERVADHPALIGTQTAQDAKRLLDTPHADQMEGDDADA